MNNLAIILESDGNLRIAHQLLQQAVKIRPDFAMAWMNLGIVEMGLKNFRVSFN